MDKSKIEALAKRAMELSEQKKVLDSELKSIREEILEEIGEVTENGEKLGVSTKVKYTLTKSYSIQDEELLDTLPSEMKENLLKREVKIDSSYLKKLKKGKATSKTVLEVLDKGIEEKVKTISVTYKEMTAEEKGKATTEGLLI